MFWELSASLVCALCGMGIYLYYVRKGQFKDSEDVKYQMFRDEE